MLGGLLSFRIVVPLLAVGVMLVVARVRKIDLIDAGLRWPTHASWPLWLVGWMVWVFAADALFEALGLVESVRWTDRSTTELVVTALGMVLLAPFTEELAFRGLLFRQVQRRLGPWAAVVLTAAAFAALHYQYGALGIATIFVDGLIFGVARKVSGSLLLTFVMHALGNLYAFVERLPT